jgi:hypothetical protein
MTDILLPKLNQVGDNEWADVEDNDKAIRDVVNGQLDNDNLSGAAGITPANLAEKYGKVLLAGLTIAGGSEVTAFAASQQTPIITVEHGLDAVPKSVVLTVGGFQLTSLSPIQLEKTKTLFKFFVFAGVPLTAGLTVDWMAIG